MGTSAFSPCSGISYIPSHDICVVSLSDGSFHVIRGISTDPSLDRSPSEVVSSEKLSAASRAVFARAEPEKVTFKDVDRVSGMAAFDCRSTFIWTYEYVITASPEAASEDPLLQSITSNRFQLQARCKTCQCICFGTALG